MDLTAPTTHGHPRRQRRLATLLGLALVSGSLGAGALSLALFTDSQAVTGNAFTTGTIDISTTPATAFSIGCALILGIPRYTTPFHGCQTNPRNGAAP